MTVALFTREWIEIKDIAAIDTAIAASPSLRGSGLKLPLMVSVPSASSLPLYEGVD